MGLASELEYHLLLAKDPKLIKPKEHAKLSSARGGNLSAGR
jgi:hypothetical protein